jgi:hypothetical protein
MALQWPFAPLKAYTNGGRPAKDGDVTRQMQAQIVTIKRLLSTGREVFDDFLASAINTGLWDVTTPGSGSAASLTNDNLANGAGAVELIAGAAGGSSAQLQAAEMPIGTYDFIFSVTARAAAAYSSNSFHAWLASATSGNEVGLVASGPSWELALGGGTPIVLGNVSTTQYHTLLVWRLQGTLYAAWDGSMVTPTAGTPFPQALDDAQLTLLNDATSQQYNVDKVRLLVDI